MIPNGQIRACVLAYSFYEGDGRVLRYAEALVKRGDQVDAVALKDDRSRPSFETINGVNLYRIQTRYINEKSKLSYLLRLVRFTIAAGLFLTRQSLKIRYDLVHVHNIPDFLVFGALTPKLRGARLILDIHDIVPELYASKFGVSTDVFGVRVLKAVEKLSARFCGHVIISNHLWHKVVVPRAIPQEKCTVLENCINLDVFHRRQRTRQDGRFIILFHGSFQRHQGLDIAVRALALLRERFPQAELHFYGEGTEKEALIRLAHELGLQEKVAIHGTVPLHVIPGIVANADCGVVPKRANLFGNEAYSSKIVEFMSQGVPVVVSRTKIDSYYFDEQDVLFFESENEKDLANKLGMMIESPPLRARLIRRGFDYIATNHWGVRKQEYLALVDKLCGIGERPDSSGKQAALAAGESH